MKKKTLINITNFLLVIVVFFLQIAEFSPPFDKLPIATTDFFYNLNVYYGTAESLYASLILPIIIGSITVYLIKQYGKKFMLIPVGIYLLGYLYLGTQVSGPAGIAMAVYLLRYFPTVVYSYLIIFVLDLIFSKKSSAPQAKDSKSK